MPSTFSNLVYHIIFSTKHREKLITERFKEELYRYIGGIIRGEGGTLIEIGGISDHVHIVVISRPAVSLSELLRKIKGNSSKWANERPGRRFKFGWQEGYSVFSVSESQLHEVVLYVKNQEEHHRVRTFQEEYIGFLKRHGLKYDEKFIWD